MPVIKTAQVWIELKPLDQFRDRFQLPRLYFWDDGARPYWAFDLETTKAFIPSSRENAFSEGLAILWATFFADSRDAKSEILNAFASGHSPLQLAELENLSELVALSKEALAAFKISYLVDSDSYVIAP